MNHIQEELQILKMLLLKMMSIVDQQFTSGQKILLKFNSLLAKKIVKNDSLVDELEIIIDHRCENILALYHPLAIDLRFILAVLKINYDLERVADYIEGVAKQLIYLNETIDSLLLKELQLPTMFECAHDMFNMAVSSFEKENLSMVNKVFEKDKILDAINLEGYKKIETFIINNPKKTRHCLYLFSILRKLERIGDLVENITEDLVFYINAKVIKHSQ